MKIQQDTPSRFWRRWTFATIAGTTTGYGVVSGLLVLLRNSDWGPFIAVLGIVVFGLCIGGFQARVLKDKLKIPQHWVVATVVGWVFVGIAFLFVMSLLQEFLYANASAYEVGDDGAEIAGGILGLGVSLLLSGGIVGLVQIGVLQKQGLDSKGWLWGSAVGWGLGIGAWFGIIMLSESHPVWSAVGGGLLMGAIAGITTGWILVKLLWH